MQSVSTITNRLIFFLFVFIISINISAQENSPFSRYGIGDLYPNQNAASLEMGGLSAALYSVEPNQPVNTNNPASYSNIGLITYDLGIAIDSRTLINNSASEKYNSVNFSPSYFVLGFPLSKKHGMGFAFGLKPLSRINYSVQGTSLVTYNNTSDSLSNIYQGNGGLNQGFFGFGKRFRFDSANRFGLNLGFNAGMNFGEKNVSTLVNIISDSLQYNASNSSVNTDMWGTFLNIGAQADFQLAQTVNQTSKIISIYTLRLGGDFTLQQKLRANQSVVSNTFYTNTSGQMVSYDTAKSENNILGNVFIPSSYTAGFSIAKTVRAGPFYGDKWMIGFEYDAAKWSDYLFYNEADRTVNTWTGRVGISFSPDPLYGKFWSRATYRLGFLTGTDYIDADGNGLKETAITFGAGFHIRVRRTYDNEYTLLNTAFQIGKRGTGVNNITENYFKFTLGFTLNDIWFIKRKYD